MIANGVDYVYCPYCKDYLEVVHDVVVHKDVPHPDDYDCLEPLMREQ